MSENLGAMIAEMRIRTSKLQSDANKVERILKSTGASGEKSFKGFHDILKKVGLAVVAVTAALVAYSTKVGVAFESKMKKVAAVTGATKEEIENLNKTAKKWGEDTEHSATMVAESMTFMGMAGLNAAETMTAVPEVLDLATVGQLDLARATDIATDTMTAYGLQVEDLSRVNDAFANTITRSNTNIEMLGESFKYVAPAAAQMGYSIEQTSAMLGTLANSGIKASMAGTNLQQAMLKNRRAAEELGTANDDLIGTLEAAKKAQWGMIEIEEHYGLIAAKSVAVLMRNVDAYKELEYQINNNRGANKELAAQFRDTTENEFKKFASVVEGIGIAMFDVFRDDFKEALGASTNLLRASKPNFIAFAGTVTKAFKATTVTVKALADALNWLNKWEGLSKTIKDEFGILKRIIAPQVVALDDLASAIMAAGDMAKEQAKNLAPLKRIHSDLSDEVKQHENSLSEYQIKLNDVNELMESTGKIGYKTLIEQQIYYKKTIDKLNIKLPELKAQLLAARDEINKQVDSLSAASASTEDIIAVHDRWHRTTEKTTKALIKNREESQRKLVADKLAKEAIEKEAQAMIDAAKAAKMLADRVKIVNFQIKALPHEFKLVDLWLIKNQDMARINNNLKSIMESQFRAIESVSRAETQAAQARVRQNELSKKSYVDLKKLGLDPWVNKIHEETIALNSSEEAVHNLIWEQEKLTRSYSDIAAESDSFIEGLILGLKDVEESQKSMGTVGYEVLQKYNSDINNFLGESLFMSITGEFDNIGDAWESLWKGMLSTATSYIAQMATEKVIGFVGSLLPEFFHTGAWDIKADEVPAILQAHELVVPEGPANIIRASIGEGGFNDLAAAAQAYGGPSMQGGLDPQVMAEAMGWQYAKHVATFGAYASQGVMGWNQAFDALTSPGAILSVATAGLGAGIKDALGIGPGLSFGTIGDMFAGEYTAEQGVVDFSQLAGRFAGIALGMGTPLSGPLGLIGEITGHYIGRALADAADIRDFENTKDIAESMGFSIGDMGAMTPQEMQGRVSFYESLSEEMQKAVREEIARLRTAAPMDMPQGLHPNPMMASSMADLGFSSRYDPATGSLTFGALESEKGAGGFGSGLGGSFGRADSTSSAGGIGGFADGGISTGPASGYPALLHGTEAIIPLKGGSVPVEISGGFDAANQGNIDVSNIVLQINSLTQAFEPLGVAIYANTQRFAQWTQTATDAGATTETLSWIESQRVDEEKKLIDANQAMVDASTAVDTDAIASVALQINKLTGFLPELDVAIYENNQKFAALSDSLVAANAPVEAFNRLEEQRVVVENDLIAANKALVDSEKAQAEAAAAVDTDAIANVAIQVNKLTGFLDPLQVQIHENNQKFDKWKESLIASNAPIEALNVLEGQRLVAEQALIDSQQALIDAENERVAAESAIDYSSIEGVVLGVNNLTGFLPDLDVALYENNKKFDAWKTSLEESNAPVKYLIGLEAQRVVANDNIIASEQALIDAETERAQVQNDLAMKAIRDASLLQWQLSNQGYTTGEGTIQSIASKYGIDPNIITESQVSEWTALATAGTPQELTRLFGITTEEFSSVLTDLQALQGAFSTAIDQGAGGFDSSASGYYGGDYGGYGYGIDYSGELRALLEQAMGFYGADYTMSDYVAKFDELGGSLADLNKSSETYYDSVIEIIGEQLSVLGNIESLNQQMGQNLAQSVVSNQELINSLVGGALAPSQSIEFFENRYQELLSGFYGAETPAAMTEFSNALNAFIPQYLEFAGAYGGDYATLTGDIVNELQGVNEAMVAVGAESFGSSFENFFSAPQWQELIDDTELTSYLENATATNDYLAEVIAALNDILNSYAAPATTTGAGSYSGGYSSATTSATTGQNMLQQLPSMLGTQAVNPWTEIPGVSVSEVIKGATHFWGIGSTGGWATMKQRLDAAKEYMNQPFKYLYDLTPESFPGESYASAMEKLKGVGYKGFKNGGISNGPMSGHWELLHGRERVEPLQPNSNTTATESETNKLLAKLITLVERDPGKPIVLKLNEKVLADSSARQINAGSPQIVSAIKRML